MKVSAGRCAVRAHRRLGAPQGARSVVRGRPEAAGRPASIRRSFPWLKQRDIALLGSDHPQYVSPSNLGPARRRSRLRAGLSGRASVRQLRPRGARRRGGGAQALGVPADGRAAADSRRHRLAAQSDRDVLSMIRDDARTRRRSARLRSLCSGAARVERDLVLGTSELQGGEEDVRGVRAREGTAVDRLPSGCWRRRSAVGAETVLRHAIRARPVGQSVGRRPGRLACGRRSRGAQLPRGRAQTDAESAGVADSSA